MKVNKILSGALIVLLQVMTFAPLQAQAAVSFERVGDSSTCATHVQNFISDTSETDLATGLAVVEATTDSRHTASIPGATWIWPTSQTIDAKNGESQTIVRDFVIVGNPMGGSMKIAADNAYQVYVNDILIGEDDDKSIDPTTYGFDEVPYNFTAGGQDAYAIPASALVTGTNTLRIEATNWSSSFTNPLVNPAGILYSMDITSQECESVCQLTVTSDSATTAHGTGAGAVTAYTDSRHTAVIDDADWIWSTAETLDAQNGENQSFTRTFAVEGDTITSAVLDIATDNSYNVIINGTVYGGDTDPYNFTTSGQDSWDISSLVTTGTNVITFEVRNWSSSFSDPKVNPAALMYSLVITTETANSDCETQNHPPVIVVIGDNPMTLTQDDIFVDPGAIANDFEDGDITANIVVGGDTVDTSIPGTYTITYNVSDSEGLAAEQKTRVVIVEPKETHVCSVEFVSAPGNTHVDNTTGPFAVAAWDQNAAWTAEEVIDTATWIWKTERTADARNGELVDFYRTITIPGTIVSAQAEVGADNRYKLYVNSTQISSDSIFANFENFKAANVGTFDITSSMTSGDNDFHFYVRQNSSSFDSTTANPAGLIYRVQALYETTENCENVVENLRPEITVDPVTVTVTVGNTYDALTGVTADDFEDGDITANIVVGGDTIDTNTVGSYLVTYNVEDSEGLDAIQKTRTIIVEPRVEVPYECVFDATDSNVTVIDFGHQRLRSDQNYGKELAAVGTNLIAGTYQVSLQTFDGYTNRVNTSQPNEKIAVRFLDGTTVVANSSETNDLIDNVERAAFAGIVDSNLVLGSDIDFIQVFHPYYKTSNPNSVEAVCGRFELLEAEQNQPPVITVDPLILNESAPTTSTLEELMKYQMTASDLEDGSITNNVTIDYADTSAEREVIALWMLENQLLLTPAQITSALNLASSLGWSLDAPYTQAHYDALLNLLKSFKPDVSEADLTTILGFWAIGTVTTPTSAPAPGLYGALYTVSDSDGAAAEPKARILLVSETNEIPVITVNPETVTITVGDTYNVLTGVTANDLEDGDITGDITTGGDAFDPNTVGTYVITYDVTDSDGNDAVQKTRTINVVPPVSETGTLTQCIILLDEAGNVITNPDNGEDFRTTVTKGAITTNVDVTTPMTLNADLYGDSTNDGYCVSVTALTGNHTYSELRAIDDSANVIDYFKNLTAFNAPKYFESASTTLTLGDFATYGTDVNSDGTITIAPDAETRLNVLVQMAEIQQGEIPVITVNPETITLTVGATSPDIKSGVQAVDNEDGVITPDLVTGGDTVDTNTIGSYVVTYDVTDSDGNDAVQKTRTYVIQPSNNGGENPPVLTLVGENPLIIYVGNPYVDPGATASDIEDGDITADIVVGGDTVKINQNASFTVTYDVTDSDGNPATQVTRQVEVRSVGGGCSGNCYGTSSPSNTKPVIVLEGANPLQLVRGQAFTEPGYIANDYEDGVITPDVVIGGDVVDTDTVGTYTITYNVKDSKGLAADQVSRVVVVGEILGETNLNCNPYFTEWLKLGDRNNEVRKVQEWLNEFLALDIKVDGIYGPETAAAVGYFQSRDSYAPIVLTPWNYTKPTYRWYKTTRMLANRLHGCPEGSKFLEDVGRTWQTTDGFTGWVDTQ